MHFHVTPFVVPLLTYHKVAAILLYECVGFTNFQCKSWVDFVAAFFKIVIAYREVCNRRYKCFEVYNPSQQYKLPKNRNPHEPPRNVYIRTVFTCKKVDLGRKRVVDAIAQVPLCVGLAAKASQTQENSTGNFHGNAVIWC